MSFRWIANQTLKMNYYQLQYGESVFILVSFCTELAVKLVQTIAFVYNITSNSLFLDIIGSKALRLWKSVLWETITTRPQNWILWYAAVIILSIFLASFCPNFIKMLHWWSLRYYLWLHSFIWCNARSIMISITNVYLNPLSWYK